MEALHCEECMLHRFEADASQSAMGHQMARVFQIDNALKSGFQMNLGDVTAREFAFLHVLRNEQALYDSEVTAQNANQPRG